MSMGNQFCGLLIDNEIRKTNIFKDDINENVCEDVNLRARVTYEIHKHWSP
jgi:hypothetical protein